MTFKKNSESGKDNVVNAVDGESKDTSSVKKKRERIAWIIGILITALIAFWAITTIVIPITRSSGAEKYSGDFRELAEAVYEFESLNNTADHHLSQLNKIHIEDIHLTTDEERVQYHCDESPERITTDPNRTMAYTVVYYVQSLGFWSKDIGKMVGCTYDIPNRWYFK